MLQRAGIEDIAELCCCGPGADNMKHWCLSFGESERSVVLAGLGGALTGGLKSGTAHTATRIVDETGEYGWVPTLAGERTLPSIIVTSTRATLSGRLARQVINRTSGAMIIDLETVAFASTATKLGWRWGAVRGISDDLSTHLPENIDQWVGDDGQTDWKYVMRALVARPTLLPVVLELRQQSQKAMHATATQIRTLLDRP